MAKEKDKDNEKTNNIIVIKKIKKGGHGHHGGSWKIAFADFVTAMMAFFLLMWLLASLNKAQKEGLAEYFKQPIRVSLFGGDSMGSRTVNLKGGGQNIEQKDGQVKATQQPIYEKKPASEVEKPGAEEDEIKQLEELKKNIMESVANDPTLADLKDRMMLDIVPEGLRIQLIDNKNKPMFDKGSDNMSPDVQKQLVKLSQLLNSNNKKISIQGHTDAHPFHNPLDLKQSNWELSSERAQAARRALIQSGLDETKIVRVSGYASTVLLDKTDPFNPNNRRISIIVMKKSEEDKMLEND